MEYKGKIVGIELNSGKKHNAKILEESRSSYLIYDNNHKQEMIVFKRNIKNINCGATRVTVI